MSVSPDLAVGLGLTIAGWLGLVFTVAHSRRVIRRLTTSLDGHDEPQPTDTHSTDDE